MIRPRSLSSMALFSLLAACGETLDPDPPEECPAELPAAPVACDAPECSATEGAKPFAFASVDAEAASSWIVISHVASNLFVNENVNLGYALESPGGLAARREARRRTLEERLGPEHHATLFGPARLARLEGEHLIRARSVRDRPSGPLLGTGIRPRAADKDDEEVLEQDESCTAADPAVCGDGALCVIPDGETDGRCETALRIKWRDQASPGQFELVDATVRQVGTRAAIVTDDADTVSDEDVRALLERFDDRIAPVDHAFFGEPVDDQGRDRDQNGVVILFLTSRVAEIDGVVGFFQATDMQPPAEVEASNGADLLYMQPPGPGITLDNLSGTIAHEYQHLINFYAKVVNRQSSPEEVWLDEGLSTFAEDVTGYGADSFKNVAAYLVSVADTSLTGFGLLADNEADADSNARRGMAHLLVRYLYEQAGGATLSGASDIQDLGGARAVRELVQSANTGADLFTPGATGRSFAAWVQDLLTVVAIDGAGFPGVSCNPAYTLEEPVPDDYTGYVRGIDLRTSMVDFEGSTIPLNGPVTIPFETSDGIPVPANGGEIRTLELNAGTAELRVTGDAAALLDFEVGLRVLPRNRP